MSVGISLLIGSQAFIDDLVDNKLDGRNPLGEQILNQVQTVRNLVRTLVRAR